MITSSITKRRPATSFTWQTYPAGWKTKDAESMLGLLLLGGGLFPSFWLMLMIFSRYAFVVRSMSGFTVQNGLISRQAGHSLGNELKCTSVSTCSKVRNSHGSGTSPTNSRVSSLLKLGLKLRLPPISSKLQREWIVRRSGLFPALTVRRMSNLELCCSLVRISATSRIDISRRWCDCSRPRTAVRMSSNTSKEGGAESASSAHAVLVV
mmetsp:Transcript_1872/g.3428  ORF Transcript_1872/g.3428 Transcript_1872/m.3428 type:complete len:209 (+) Transcript_1872:217-843(+)